MTALTCSTTLLAYSNAFRYLRGEHDMFSSLGYAQYQKKKKKKKRTTFHSSQFSTALATLLFLVTLGGSLGEKELQLESEE